MSLLLTLLAGAGWAQEGYHVEEFSLPPRVSEVLGHPDFARSYRISFHVNPFYLNGDFNGDGKPDTAVLIRETSTNKTGIAVVHAGADKPLILGAGTFLLNEHEEGLDNFSWLDAWYVYPRGVVEEGADAGPPPTLKGDAIYAMKSESASGLIYWTGEGFAWYQQGD